MIRVLHTLHALFVPFATACSTIIPVSFPTNPQYSLHTSPILTSLPSRSSKFALAWIAAPPTSSSLSVLLQVFSANGTRVVPETDVIIVNSMPNVGVSDVAVSSFPDGSVVVTWAAIVSQPFPSTYVKKSTNVSNVCETDDVENSDDVFGAKTTISDLSSHIFIQLFSPTFQKVGPETPVTSSGWNTLPSVTTFRARSSDPPVLAVSWSSQPPSTSFLHHHQNTTQTKSKPKRKTKGTLGTIAYVQLFYSDVTPISSPTRISSFYAPSQTSIGVVSRSLLIVTFISSTNFKTTESNKGQMRKVMGQLVNRKGEKVGVEFGVSDPDDGGDVAQVGVKIARRGGGYVVTYVQQDDGGDSSIMYQVMNERGARVFERHQTVAFPSMYVPSEPQHTLLSDDSIFVTWNGYVNNKFAVFGQHINPRGKSVENDMMNESFIELSEEESGDAILPTVVTLREDWTLVAWTVDKKRLRGALVQCRPIN